MTRVAQFISWLFLPLLIPIYALVIVMYVPSVEMNLLQPNSLFVLGDEQKLAVLYLFTLFSFLAPAIVVVFMRMQGFLSSIMMENRKERYIPAIATLLSGIALIYTIFAKIKPEMYGFVFLVGLAVGSLITVIVCTALTFKFKVSLHSAGMGILCGFLMAYNAHMFLFELKYIVIAFLLSGIVMSSRLYLKLHTQRELLLGFAIGFISVMCSCIYLYSSLQA